MGEDKIQKEQPMNRATTIEASPKTGGLVWKKIGKAFSEMYGLFTKGKEKDRASAGDSFKSVPALKKPAVLMPSSFHAPHVNLKSINQVLAVLLAGLFALMFYVTFRQKPAISSVMSAVSRIKIMDIQTKPMATFNELSFYLDQVTKRNIFRVFEEKKPPVKVVEPVEPPPPPKVTIQEKAKNFKLMGISWGDNPKAIIRDTTDQSMYFVNVGEKIKGTDLTIEQIFKDQVVISSEGDEMSMY